MLFIFSQRGAILNNCHCHTLASLCYAYKAYRLACSKERCTHRFALVVSSYSLGTLASMSFSKRISLTSMYTFEHIAKDLRNSALAELKKSLSK